MMQTFAFDKDVFRKGFAFPYTVLQYFFLGGFLAALLIVIASASAGASITIPDGLLIPVCGYLFLSLAGFPIVCVLKAGAERSVKESTLILREDALVYDRLAARLWTAVGHVQERHIYTVTGITHVEFTRRFCIVTGTVELAAIHNGRAADPRHLTSVKIPRAYARMAQIRCHTS